MHGFIHVAKSPLDRSGKTRLKKKKKKKGTPQLTKDFKREDDDPRLVCKGGTVSYQ